MFCLEAKEEFSCGGGGIFLWSGDITYKKMHFRPMMTRKCITILKTVIIVLKCIFASHHCSKMHFFVCNRKREILSGSKLSFFTRGIYMQMCISYFQLDASVVFYGTDHPVGGDHCSI